MVKILVADDETDFELLIKQKFRRHIREHKYEFLFALNGNEALKKLKEHPDVEVLLTDINMPELDGLTLLTRINEVNPLIKAVMVSAYSDMDNIRTAMNRGAFDFVCKPVNFQDLEVTIEKTIHHVEEIKKTLEAIKENNILRMYVDESVLKIMGSNENDSPIPANETIEATVAFIDICSFTSITEHEPPNEVVKMLNTYFDVMAKEIIAQNGYIDKFIGDAVLAVFKGEYHLDCAVEASLAVRTQIANLPNQSQQQTFLPKVSIGINSGEMVRGNIGSAKLRRLDYTVIGDVVNTAQRLQSVAQSGQILITESACQKIKESFKCNKIGEVRLKNKGNPVVIYEVLE
jgi:class 3 adenylate cyclase